MFDGDMTCKIDPLDSAACLLACLATICCFPLNFMYAFFTHHAALDYSFLLLKPLQMEPIGWKEGCMVGGRGCRRRNCGQTWRSRIVPKLKRVYILVEEESTGLSVAFAPIAANVDWSLAFAAMITKLRFNSACPSTD